MDNVKRIEKLKEEKYQVLFGIQKATFEAMLAILESAYKEMRKKGGKERQLSVLDMLIITLGYYHDYRTMENIAFDYGCHKQRISEAVSWVEETLILDGTFALPAKHNLKDAETEVSIVVADVTECETERPKKNSRNPTQASRNATQSKT
jgi:hypothetical protein